MLGKSALLIGIVCLAACSSVSLKNPETPPITRQQVVRIWKGEQETWIGNARTACGIPDTDIQDYLSRGWRIVSSTPFSYVIRQSTAVYDCVGSEVLLEK